MSSYGGMSHVPSIVTPPPNSSAPSSPPLGGTTASDSEQQIRLQILASLFPPGSANGAFIAHLKTWEDVPGAPSGSNESKKPRYILLAVQSDGRLKIHKSKRNTNGTFSVGKTWNLEDLKALEVHKPRRSAGPSSFAVTCFTITINTKAYLWETESVRHQDDFLVMLVRSFRQYMNGAHPRMVGFQVGEIPGAPPAYEIPREGGGVATPTLPMGGTTSQSQQSPRQNAANLQAARAMGTTRPGTANSIMSNDSSHYGGGGEHSRTGHSFSSASGIDASGAMGLAPSNSGQGFAQTVGMRPSASAASSFDNGGPRSRNISPSPSTQLQQQTQQQPQSFAQVFDQAQQVQVQGGGRPTSPYGQQAVINNMRKKASASSLRDAAVISPNSPSRPPLPIPPTQQAASPRAPSPTKQYTPAGTSRIATTPTRQMSNPFEQQPSTSSPRRPSGNNNNNASSPLRDETVVKTPGTAVSLDETQAAANAAALLGQQGSRPLEDDSDIMLTNVEEMLEGLEWGASSSGEVNGTGGNQGADQIEKRLLGELNALEAAGIHAIIESDDRVIDVVKYLDNALAELDKMDQMLSLYKTHLHVVSDDIAHVESQNKGLQIQSSNQRALLAELDRRLGK